MNQNDLYIIISAAVAKLAAVMFLTFGARVLLTLYSYHTRLAAFYEARADAFRILPRVTLDELEQFVRITAPDQITFDPLPESPVKDIADLLKAAGGSKEK